MKQPSEITVAVIGIIFYIGKSCRPMVVVSRPVNWRKLLSGISIRLKTLKANGLKPVVPALGPVGLLSNKGQLSICHTANQDNPLMKFVDCKGRGLGIDVRGHAYYLKHQNKHF